MLFPIAATFHLEAEDWIPLSCAAKWSGHFRTTINWIMKSILSNKWHKISENPICTPIFKLICTINTWVISQFIFPDPLIYSGGETSGLESAYTSPSVHHKDFIEQYLNKLSYLPGDVITNSEPAMFLSSASQPQPSYNLPTSYSTAAMKTGLTAVNTGFDDILERDLLFNSVSVEPDPLLGQTPVHALGPSMQSSSRAVDMLEIPGNYWNYYFKNLMNAHAREAIYLAIRTRYPQEVPFIIH